MYVFKELPWTTWTIHAFKEIWTTGVRKAVLWTTPIFRVVWPLPVTKKDTTGCPRNYGHYLLLILWGLRSQRFDLIDIMTWTYLAFNKVCCSIWCCFSCFLYPLSNITWGSGQYNSSMTQDCMCSSECLTRRNIIVIAYIVLYNLDT